MSDTLEIFGQEWTGVTGFKATDDNDLIKTFIRPQGTVSITANGTGIDVSQYASADVAVPSVETNFIVTLSWDSTQQKWLPDCTMADLWGAYQAGKTIALKPPDGEVSDIVTADGFWTDDEVYVYFVQTYTNPAPGINGTQWRAYVWTTNGVALDDTQTYIQPTGTISITQNGQGIDVSQYASANVAVSGGNDFVVTVSWNSGTQRFEPNKTFSEIQTAYNAGKTIAVVSSEQSVDSSVDGEYHTGANPYFEYWVRKYMDGYSPQTIRETGYHLTSSGINTEDEINYIRPTGSETKTANGTYDVTNLATLVVNVSGSSKNIQVNQTGGSVRTNGYTSTGVSLTVAKAGTYKVTWTAWRSSSQGTMGTNLYRNGTAGTAQQTWTSTYGQHITLNNQTYAQGDILTLYATAGSTTRYCYVGDLVIVEQ